MPITWRQLTSDVTGVTNAAVRGMENGRKNIAGMLTGFRNQLRDHVDERTAQNEADLRSYLDGLQTPDAFTEAQASGAIQERIAGYGEFAPADRFQSLVSDYPDTLRKRVTDEQAFNDAQAERSLKPVYDDIYSRLRNGDTAGASELMDQHDLGSREGAMTDLLRQEEARLKGRANEASSRKYFAELSTPGAFNTQKDLDAFTQRVASDPTLSAATREALLSNAQQRAADGSMGAVDSRNFKQFAANLGTSMGITNNMYYQESQNPDAFSDTLNSAAGIKDELLKSGMSEGDATNFSAGLFEVVARGVPDGNGGYARLPMSPALVRMIKDQATDLWLKNDLTASEVAEQAIHSLGLAQQYANYTQYESALTQERARLLQESGRRPTPEPVNQTDTTPETPKEKAPVPSPVSPKGPTSPVQRTEDLITALRGVSESNIKLSPEQERKASSYTDKAWGRQRAQKAQMSELRDLRGEYIELMQELSSEVPPSFIDEARRGNNLGAESGKSRSGRTVRRTEGTKDKLSRMVELENKLREFVTQ